MTLKGMDTYHATPIHSAALNGHAPVVKLLLDRGVDVKTDGRDFCRMVPLHCATENGNEEVIELLLDRGADVNVLVRVRQDWTIETPLTLAMRKDRTRWSSSCSIEALTSTSRMRLFGLERVVQLLLLKGADVNQRVYPDWTTLQYAAGSGHERVVKLLL